jgi:hypothetical protein
MRNSDFLPRPDRKFLSWVINFLKYLMGRLERFNFPQDLFQKLEQAKNVFAQALELSEEPTTHTKVTIQEKNDARKALETTLRQAIAEYLTHNHLLTDGDRQLLGLPVHKTTHTPVPAPTTVPEAEVALPSPAVVEIHFRDAESEHKAKPTGVHGAEIAWAILDTPTTDWALLTHSSFDTHTPFRLSFEGPDRGKTLFFALRWENTRGEKGPWSEIQSAIIP